MKKICLTLLAVVCAGILFTSCTKKEYVDSNGGQDYTAYATVFDIGKTSWQWDNTSKIYTITKTIDDITSDITDKGAVWIYFSYNGGNDYEQLPSNGYVDNSGNSFDFIGSSGDNNDGKAGHVTLVALPYSGNSNSAPDVDIKVKVVSIPSSTVNQISNVNPKDYNAVKAALHLND